MLWNFHYPMKFENILLPLKSVILKEHVTYQTRYLKGSCDRAERHDFWSRYLLFLLLGYLKVSCDLWKMIFWHSLLTFKIRYFESILWHSKSGIWKFLVTFEIRCFVNPLWLLKSGILKSPVTFLIMYFESLLWHSKSGIWKSLVTFEKRSFEIPFWPLK